MFLANSDIDKDQHDDMDGGREGKGSKQGTKRKSAALGELILQIQC